MKLLIVLLFISSAFAQDELAKAFNKREEKDCARLFSAARKRTRTKAGITGNIEKVEIGKSKNNFALLYLKLNSGVICSEQPSRTNLGTIFIQYTCRDKSGKVTLDKSIDDGYSDCEGDSPKLN